MKYLSQKQNNKPINIQLTNVDEYSNEYKISALDDNGNEMGYATFSVNKKERKVWLRKIETYSGYQNLGVAKAILDVLEYFTVQNRLCMIEGKFFPDNEFARPFYEKNNYDIYKEDYETFVGKYIGNDTLSNETKKRIVDYEVLYTPEETKDM